MPLIQTVDITKTFWTGVHELGVLRGISISIESGEFVSIIGKSGSGKTTLMNILGCLDVPSSGQYFFDGENVADADPDALALIRNRRIGFVFQTFNLLEDLSVIDNVALPQLYAGKRESEARAIAQEKLVAVGLEERLTYYPNQLSGGQRQRVAIARALVNEPALILADEPTGNLDSKTGEQIIEIFKKLNDEHKITFIVVTHDRELADKTQRIIEIVDGKIIDGKNHTVASTN